MEKTIRKFADLAEMKVAELLYWQGVPGYVRLNAAAELSEAAFRLKGMEGNVPPRLDRSLVLLRRPSR